MATWIGSLLSFGLQHVFHTRPKRNPRRAQSRSRLGFQRLEQRQVFAASFGTALSIGDDELRATMVTDLATDDLGNTYLTGSFAGDFDFDPTPGVALRTARGSGDVFVAKYRFDGSLDWVQQMGGDSVASGPSDRARRIALGPNGSVFVSGQFLASADFGPSTLTSLGSHDAFLAKLDSAGNIQWARQYGTTSTEVGWSVDVDAQGNSYLLSTNAQTNIQKFRPDGGLAWTKIIANNPTSWASESNLAVDAAGNLFVTGNFRGSVDFDPSNKQKLVVGSGTAGSGFVVKWDTNGSFKWVSPFLASPNTASGSSAIPDQIALDGAGSVIVGGYYRGLVDFDPSSRVSNLPSIGGAFISKLDASGGLLWVKALESADNSFLNGFDIDASGNIYASGNTWGTVDLDPSVNVQSYTTAGQADGFVLKLSSTGDLNWAVTFGSASMDVPLGISVTSAGEIHVGGWYTGDVDFDPDPFAAWYLNSGPQAQGFWWRLNQS